MRRASHHEVGRPASPGVQSSAPVVFLAAGSLGGTRNAGGPERSRHSSRLSAAPSRLVRAGRLYVCSMRLRIDVWSRTTCETWSGREYGETTTAGTRNP